MIKLNAVSEHPTDRHIYLNLYETYMFTLRSKKPWCMLMHFCQWLPMKQIFKAQLEIDFRSLPTFWCMRQQKGRSGASVWRWSGGSWLSGQVGWLRWQWCQQPVAVCCISMCYS